ncbi:MAG: DUF1127 domain-containing protein [Gammaproteobacteria bacterium]|nr:DUF1127 domain-containing protein [Gammaproteobacteria bacterium]
MLDSLAQPIRLWLKNQSLKHKIHQERQSLLSMSDAMLKDIGISQADAEQEASRDDVPLAREMVSNQR